MLLAANVSETPRPRPPAKVRRSTLLKAATSTPPPAYAPAPAFTFSPENKPRLDTLLGSPMAATFKRLGWSETDSQLPPSPEEDKGWMDEKSREELSELLIKAEDLIKERESGMCSHTMVPWSRG